MSVRILLARMVVLFCYLAVGVFSSKMGYLEEDTCKKLNKLVLNFCAPAMVFNSVLASDYDYALEDILSLLGYAVVFDVVMILVALAAVAVFCGKHPDRGTYSYLIAFGNCVFMGFSLIASLLGNSAVFLGAMCSLPFNMLSFSVGIRMLSGRGAGQFWKQLLNPPFLANIVAFFLFLFPIQAPAPVLEILGGLGGMVVPMSMILIGASLGKLALQDIFSDWRVYGVAVCKLVLAPVVVFWVCRCFIRDNQFLNVITISAAMPSATVSQILATEYGGNPALAGKTVLVTTLCSLITIPLLLPFLLV